MRHVLVKVYAAFSDADEACRDAVAGAGGGALGTGEPWLFLEDGLLRISWEGMYFPLDEVVAALEHSLGAAAEGKLDYLDLDAWTLTRYVADGSGAGRFVSTTRSLNQVLEYSGH